MTAGNFSLEIKTLTVHSTFAAIDSSLIFRMVQFLSFFCVALMVLETSTRCQSFSLTTRPSAVRRLKSSNALSMSTNTLSNILGLMPLCLTATSKTTTTNDPTAGMSPEEIVNYISNVGGGMCGYPEWVRGSIGVGLNLSLLAFGIATVSYGELKIQSSILGRRIRHISAFVSHSHVSLLFQSFYRAYNFRWRARLRMSLRRLVRINV